MTRWTAVAAALVIAVAGVALAQARADTGTAWECGGFEVPLHTWNKSRASWMTPSENGLVLEAGANGAILPAGWTPIGGANGPVVVACRPPGGLAPR